MIWRAAVGSETSERAQNANTIQLATMNATVSISTAVPVLQPSSDASAAGHPNVNLFTYVVCMFGISGNLLALFVLHRSRSSTNKRHVFMLRCLATNDGITLASKLVRTFVKDVWPSAENTVWMCRSRILSRFFVWGSGCAGLVMAIDRWLALTEPYFYQRHISLRLLKKMMVLLWIEVMCMVCLPFFGFGVHWDEKSLKCLRMRDAVKPWDVRYNYFYFGHCIILLVIIIYTNLAVVKALCKKDSLHNLLMKRQGTSLACNAATKEERSFAWLMLWLSVVFVIFCVPEMLAIVLFRFIEDKKKIRSYYTVSDVFLSVHLTLEPCMNVLYHWKVVKSICSWMMKKKNVNDGRAGSSTRTTDREVTQQPL